MSDKLLRLTKRQLETEYRRILAEKGIRQVYGGPVTKEEYIRAILREGEGIPTPDPPEESE